jgi:hypothetical protein
MARDAENHAVVELRRPAIGVPTHMVSMERLLGKITTAALAFAVGSDEKLSGLTRSETAARVRAWHG